MQIESFLEESARRTPSKTALVCGARRLTYAEVDEMANRLGNSLLNHGVQRGDRVAVFMENSVEAVVSIFAILKAGAVFTVINPSFQAAKAAYILNHSGVVAVLSSASCFQVLRHAIRSVSNPLTIGMSGEVDLQSSSIRKVVSLNQVLLDPTCDRTQPPKSCIDIDLAALIYTSGSVAVPKAVAMTHLNLGSATSSIVTYLEHTADGVILSVLPLSFSDGLGQVMVAFKSGATLILETISCVSRQGA